MKKVEAVAALAASEAKGFSALRSGLGLAPGDYKFTTPNNEDIFGVKEVKSNKDGKQYALTIVAGTVSNGTTTATFGLGDKDRQMVVTLDQWNAIEPNQSYDLTIDKNGRIASVVLVSEEVLAN